MASFGAGLGLSWAWAWWRVRYRAVVLDQIAVADGPAASEPFQFPSTLEDRLVDDHVAVEAASPSRPPS